jgi:hypothetical protein
MINKAAYYFEDNCKCEAMTDIQKRVWFYDDGEILVTRRFETTGRENTSIFSTPREFAEAFPVLSRDIFQWMRDHKHNIKDLEFKGHDDLVPMKKHCPLCHKEKALTEFPKNDVSFDGTHRECCECRIRECQDKKMQCQAPMLPKCTKCPVCGPRKETWNSLERL